MSSRLVQAALLLSLSLPALAQTAAPAAPDDTGKLVAAGTVPDEAARAAILGRLRELYGAANVVDRLEVGGVVPPPGWADNMTRLLSGRLRQVHGGRLEVSGTRVALKGTVANEALRQQVVSEMAGALNPTYTIDNALMVGGGGQGVLDKTLANRVVEFETASARLTPAGSRILDEMAEAIKRIGTPRLQLIGHTDGNGRREANLELSLARANSVRNYLIEKGIPADSLAASGAGPDRPLGSNDTAEGRARNRRIEFRLGG